MTRRSLLALVAGLHAAVSSGAEIAVLKSGETAAWRPALEAIKRGLAGQAVTELDARNDKAEADRAVAAVKGKVAAIVALGPLAARAARDGAPELPLVVCMVADMAKAGVVPAPNVTGIAFHPPIKNQLAAFRLVNPRGVRVGVVYNPANVGPLVQEAQKAAAVVRLQIVEKPIATEKDVPPALRALVGGADAVDALWLPPDPALLGDEARRFLFTETLKAGKPVYTFSAALVQEGALVSDGPDYANTGEQAAELVTRLLGPEKGARIEFATPRAELVVNKRVADRLKIELSPEVLKLAKVF